MMISNKMMIISINFNFINIIIQQVLRLSFGHWEIFKMLILSLRDAENAPKNVVSFKNDSKDKHDGGSSSLQQQSSSSSSHGRSKPKSVIEKQVMTFNFH
jgi:hypothetical protein